MYRPRPPVRRQTYVFVFVLIAVFMGLAHGPILDVPFYWDEAGQFIPAALDLYHAGAAIPHSTLPNVHPPGVMAYLALFWHLFGFSVTATRLAMLLLASFGVLFTLLLAIELGRGSPGAPAFVAVALLCVSPLFFAQSMLALLDMPAMCCSVFALLLFLQNRIRGCALVCVALVLVKETGLASAGLFAAWLFFEKRGREAAWFALPAAALALWLVALRSATGHWMGNAEFTQYNLFYPLHPARLAFALLRRGYYLFIGTGHFIGGAAVLWAWRRMPLFRDRPWRIAGAYVAVNTLAVSILGGAVLERYLLPVLPVLYIAFAMALRALPPRPRQVALAGLMVSLMVANFVNPLYPFPYENNLAFVSFVEIGKEAAAAVAARPGVVATTFPMADALRRPALGYVDEPKQVVELRNFHAAEVSRLSGHRPDMLLVYNTEWDPLHLLRRAPVEWLLRKFYGVEPQLTPAQVARMLSMHVLAEWTSRGLSMSLLVRDPRPGGLRALVEARPNPLRD